MRDYSDKEVLDIVEAAAKKNNVPRDDFLRFTAIETGFTYDERAHNQSSGAKGIFQFLPDTAKQYGIAGREFDPVANADAGARLYNDNKQDIIASHNRSGRPYLSGEAEPNGLDLYMAHQQGAYGYRSIQAALDRGTFFDDTPTRRNLLANVGNDIEGITGVKKSELNGLSDRDLAKTFMQYWDTKYDRIAIPEKGIQPLDNSQPNRPSPSNPTPADPMADGVLRRNEEGAAVRKLQEDLTRAGFSTQGTDGKFGQNTEDAVKRYQTSRGLESDGIAGPATLRAISESQPSQQPPTTGTPAPTQPAPTQPAPANPEVDRSWPAPGNFTVNTANKPGEGEGEFGTSRGGGARTHKGIDINGAVGDPIESMRPGKVTFAGNGGAGAGNMIIIDHGGGLETRYLHLQNINVREGQQVTEDTKIGTMGRTGNTPAAGDTHLHFETRENGVAVDPRKYLNFPARDMLQQGDEGKDVTRLQEALVRNGATIKPDGDFGPGTKAAVEAFQRSNNLTPDGIAGPATQRALGVTQEQAQTPAPTAPTTPSPTTPAPTTPAQSGAMSDGVLKQGEQGEDVRKLQEALNKNGATLNADGNFGPATKAAVESYQRANNLEADGVAGPKTLAALNPTPQQAQQAATQPTPAQDTAPQPTAAQPATTQQTTPPQTAPQQTAPQQANPETPAQPQAGGLKPGDSGPAVTELQQKLAEHGGRCGCNSHGLTPDGNYGKMTELAVQDFQRANNLPPTGVADDKTLNALGIKPQQQAETTPSQPTQPTQPSATDKPQTPPAANDQVQPPTQGDKPLMSNPNHPDNRLYQQAVSNLEQLGPGGGFKSREDLEKAAASVAADAKATGLQSIDHISKTAAPNGQAYLVAVQGDPTSPAAKNSYIDYNQATSQTVAQSTGMAEAQKPAVQQAQTPAAQQTDPQQEPTRLAAGAR